MSKAIPQKIPLTRRPWFAFLSSMRFAVALLSLLALASVIGTVLQQNQQEVAYLVEFGSFWHQIFQFLGLYDVYSSAWFVVIMAFLMLSTGLCLWRNIPPFLREMRSFRLNATAKSLSLMHHNATLPATLSPDAATRYLKVSGFAVKQQTRDDGSFILAAKKGAMNKWGYICAHAAIIVICLGGLIDSNMGLKIAILTGKLKPDAQAVYLSDFGSDSQLDSGTLSFRGDVNIRQGQTVDKVFLNTGKGLLVQDLPFSVQLKQFNVEHYDTGMPKNFASELIITDKTDGQVYTPTLRVNHPFTLHGITLYQASFGDGGSDLTFRSWHLPSGSPQSAPLTGTSMASFPLTLAEKQAYTLEFAELSPMNVEDEGGLPEDKTLRESLNDVRSVRQEKTMRNVGPKITFRLRDAAGQAKEYVNYMLPLQRNGDYYFATGERKSLEEPYRWLMIPADQNGKIDTFMHLRATLLNPTEREAVIDEAVKDMQGASRERFREALNNTLILFTQQGFIGINNFVREKIPADEQTRMGELFYQMLHGAGNLALERTLKAQGIDWPVSEARHRFLLNSLEAYTGMTQFESPVLLQLDGYREVKSSGIQMTRSPGQGLVYLGSLLLVLGCIFMFYVREKRLWLLFENGQIRFAMSSSRHRRELDAEFPQHQHNLTRLAQELTHHEPD